MKQTTWPYQKVNAHSFILIAEQFGEKISALYTLLCHYGDIYYTYRNEKLDFNPKWDGGY